MPTFLDKRGRVIELVEDIASLSAYHDGRIIGSVSTTDLREVDLHFILPAKITGWEVKEGYRRAGIATEMVRILFNELGPLAPPDLNIGKGNQNALTDEGIAITLHCQELGYVLPFPRECNDEIEY